MAYLLILTFLVLQSPSPIPLLIAITFHELSHIIAALILTKSRPGFCIRGIGFILDCGPMVSTKQKIIINTSGPAINLLLWILFYHQESFRTINLGLFIINLLPCSFLDGGQILKAILERFTTIHTAYITLKALTYLTFCLIFIFNCTVQLKFGTNLSLLCFTIFFTLTLYGKDVNL